tara:strand:- start:1891 stop:2496 length:606 start_codon:yes stop_codon:yes gene_type:complete
MSKVDSKLPYYGMEDDLFEKRVPLNGQITKREIRALTISLLQLSHKSVVWDIGSATGSVAIEASRIAINGEIIAVEKDSKNISILKSNVSTHNAYNVKIIEGAAPDILYDLSSPDSIFIGGTGGQMDEIIRYSSDRLMQDGIIVMNFASIERSVKAYNLLKHQNMEASYMAVNISKGRELPDESLVLSPMNPVFIVQGKKQ